MMSDSNATQDPEGIQEPYASAPTPAWMPYTRTGDNGETALGNHARIGKTDPRIIAYGACDETSSFLGFTVNTGTGLTHSMVRLLTRVQNDLVDVAADICAPQDGDEAQHLRIDNEYIARLERACDYFNAGLAQPSSFVVPGGTATAALLHYAYSLTRRAERCIIEVLRHDHERANPLTQNYLNRLANLLLVFARVANEEHGDSWWQPRLTAQLKGAELWEPHPDDIVEH